MNTGILRKILNVQGTTGSLKLEYKEQADGPGGRTSKADGIWTTESLASCFMASVFNLSLWSGSC